MENELIMMIYIFFTVIKNELIFKVPESSTADEFLTYVFLFNILRDFKRKVWHH